MLLGATINAQKTIVILNAWITYAARTARMRASLGKGGKRKSCMRLKQEKKKIHKPIQLRRKLHSKAVQALLCMQ
jgi:hypothetical protein